MTARDVSRHDESLSHVFTCVSLAHVNPTSEPLLNLGGQQWIRFLHRQKPADLETENRCGVESGNKLKSSLSRSAHGGDATLTGDLLNAGNMHARIFLRSRFYPGLRG